MKLSTPMVRKYLKECSLERLFIEELGWDRYTSTLSIEIGGCTYTLEAFAEKRGVQIFQCNPDSAGNVPDYNVRRKIEKYITKIAYEHLIIFVDHYNTVQIWQWVARKQGMPAAYREHTYHPRVQFGDALIQKLEVITIPLDEEEALDLTGTVHRLRDAFDRDRVTKRFYDRFKKEHEAFLSCIEGMENSEDLEWYASLMLNRLMFMYFIQKKGFLDGDQHYLRNRLRLIKKRKGKDIIYTFYRYFLLTLFHEGFSKRPDVREIDKELLDLLGDIPFLNGGLFEVHELEKRHPTLDISDEAFSRLFGFFDQYEWHLDTRPLRNDREINPDVLGYIFEKYVNQKQMGAYYTKEDITDYISQNTVIPYLLYSAQEKCAVVFDSDFSILEQLKESPERYIYSSVKNGVDHKLPESIEQGIIDVSKRDKWNETAPPELGVPTETWREIVSRRKHCEKLKTTLKNGEVKRIEDLITHNLDIRQYAQDLIENCDNPEFLLCLFNAIQDVTVLDPACGSGAFLFAALNILEVLYDACIERMRVFVEEANASGEYEEFEVALNQLQKHPNRDYYIYKSIMVNNLYGVDIMEEAVEICKLRLFLKLVAQIDKVENIEPLPDIDFNIKAGNSLVGYASESELEKSQQITLGSDEWLDAIKSDTEILGDEFAKFKEMQVFAGGAPEPNAKERIKELYTSLEHKLNTHLAIEYGIDPNDSRTYMKWQTSHKPFHWWTSFYEIMQSGGFNVVIGNPPYVEYRKVRDEYTIRNYETETCGNLYAYMIERSLELISMNGFFSFIVQLPIVCTDRMIPLQRKILSEASKLWFSNYDDRPAKLFDGLEHIRATIFVLSRDSSDSRVLRSTRYNRWYSENRGALFGLLLYGMTDTKVVRGSIPKLGSEISLRVLEKITKYATVVFSGDESLYYHNSPQYWIRAMDFAPYFWNERDGEHVSSQNKTLFLPNKDDAMAVVAVLNSSLFYWWFIIFSDCRHLNVREIVNFPFGLDNMKKHIQTQLRLKAEELMEDLRRNANRKRCTYKTTGRVIYDEFFPRFSKPIIDNIDEILAEHYGFTEEELDFIVNYDIKYRMGSR